MDRYTEPVLDGLTLRESGPWARVKLDYLQRYLDVFTKSMHSKWQMCFVDLFAGPGKNLIRDTGEIALGSPLLALKTRYPFDVCYFVECEPNNSNALATRVAASPRASTAKIVQDDCNQAVHRIAHELRTRTRQSLNLAFLDPEGLELQWQTVATLAGVGRMDLIINYPEAGLNRTMTKVVHSTTVTAVDRFFGDTTWRNVYKDWQLRRGVGLHRGLIDLYRARLRDLGYTDVLSLNGLQEPLVRSTLKRAPLYRLVFASKHSLGDRFWSEITRRDLYGQRKLFGS